MNRGLIDRSILISLAIAVILIGGAFYVSSLGQQKTTETFVRDELKGKSGDVVSGMFLRGQDSDKDGLSDWEEDLWKTDKNNPDTDGDGMLDGEEVKKGRNPLKAGPNDTLEPPQFVLSATSTEITESDAFAREIFTTFWMLYNTGNLNPETKRSLAEYFATKALSEEINLESEYFLSDLKIINEEDVKALKKYGNDLARIIKKYQPLIKENDINILVRAGMTKDKTVLGEIDNNISVYQNSIDELLRTEVPVGIAVYHLNFINSLYNIKVMAEEMKKLFSDPLRAMRATMQYIREYYNLEFSLKNISDYFSQKGVYFEKEDDGYIFIYNRK